MKGRWMKKKRAVKEKKKRRFRVLFRPYLIIFVSQ